MPNLSQALEIMKLSAEWDNIGYVKLEYLKSDLEESQISIDNAIRKFIAKVGIISTWKISLYDGGL